MLNLLVRYQFWLDVCCDVLNVESVKIQNGTGFHLFENDLNVQFLSYDTRFESMLICFSST